MFSNSKFDVKVISFSLDDHPARIKSIVEVAGQCFTSTISYHSIPSWDALWRKHGLQGRAPEILGAIVAWDCMRFLALGGETLSLCAGLAMSDDVKAMWRHCFLRQFGEWRYRNAFEYRSQDLPRCISAPVDEIQARGDTAAAPDVKRRILLTNGGGKDSLVGMLLLNDAQVPYDIYEGTLPLGGAHKLQRDLLKDLRAVATREERRLITVEVSDDFFSSEDSRFAHMGVETHHIKSDFAVGHTANYVGYIPIILEHDYSGVWFNIEASADRTMAVWNGEDINHQWCKSVEYQEISTNLFRLLTGQKFKDGFSSTLRGAYDTVIYAIAASEPEMLAKAHSCNIDKPWCRKCPKCCFSYLMMSSMLGEAYAKTVMGTPVSLFEDLDNRSNWRDLLDAEHVAWECVPSHRECLQAVDRCRQRGIRPQVFDEFAGRSSEHSPSTQFLQVKWDAIPAPLRGPLLHRMGKTGMRISTEVVIVGAGQAGLSMSHTLKSQNIEHLVLEADSVGASWKNRWDSFQINTPNSTIALPGLPGTTAQGFMGHAEVQQLLAGYADANQLPVATQVKVISARKSQGRFLLETPACEIETKALIVATGEYAAPRIPAPLKSLSADVELIHSSRYRNPKDLPAGAVLVVGGGQSGAQIVEDLLDAGRQVYWSLSDRPSNIRRLRGKDFMEWWDIGGLLHNHVSEDPAIRMGIPGALFRARTTEFPLVSGKGSDGLGRSISLQLMAQRGVTLLGKLEQTQGQVLSFRDVRPQVERAIAGTRAEYEKLSNIADIYYEDREEPPHEDEERFLPMEMSSGWLPEESPAQLDLASAGISAVVAATGFNAGWSWLHVDGILDSHGYPLGQDGVAPVSGLFFMGMFNIQRLSSTCLCNGGRDADMLLPHVKDFLGEEELTMETVS